MDSSKKKVLVGVAVVVVVVVMTIVLWPRKEKFECVPSKDKPDLGSKKVASSNSKVLAGVTGYVRLHEDDTYLPFDLESVVVNGKEKDGSQTVTLKGKCVSLDLKYQTKDNNYQYQELEMKIKNGAKKEKEFKKYCDFSTKFACSHSTNEYYSCNNEQSHQCVSGDSGANSTKTTVASLVLKSFEFEFDGKEESVKKGEFDKTRRDGCTYWPDDTPKEKPCVPKKDKPTANPTKIASTDSKVLATLAGYVQLDDQAYLPVELKSVENTEGSVTLSGECVKLKIGYAKEKDEKGENIYNYKSVSMEILNSETSEFQETCKFDNQINFKQPSENYYSCGKEQPHKCSSTDKKSNTNLVLTSIAFELEGDEEKVKQNEFNKKEDVRSCDGWKD